MTDFPKIPQAHQELRLRTGSDHQPFYGILQRPNLAHQVAGIIRCDACRYDCTTNAARSTQRNFAWNVDVGHVFIFREQGEMEENSQRSCIWVE